MHFYRVDNQKEFNWDEKDFYVEVKQSNLRRARNAHLLIGFVSGIAATVGGFFLYMWAWVGV